MRLDWIWTHIVIAYYQQWGGSNVNGYLNNGWEVVNAAWSPLYIVGSGRINVAGMTEDNMDALCGAIASVSKS